MKHKIKRYMLPLLRSRRLALAGLAVLGVLAIAAAFAYLPSTLAAGGVGMLAFFGMGAIVMPEEDFQKRVLEGIEAQNKRIGEMETGFKSSEKKVLDDLDRADKEVKTALEGLTTVKNTVNTSYGELMGHYKRLQTAVRQTARSSFGDPIKRALANEETTFALNAAARYVLSLDAKSGYRCDPAHARYIEEAISKAKSLTGVDSSLGQATVPQQTFDEIYDTLLEYGDWPTLGVERVGMRTTVLPLATARPQFYWIGSQTGTAEGSVISSGSFTGGQVLLIIQTLAVLMYVARELLADSSVDLAPFVMRQMAESIAWGMDMAAFIGTGNVDQTNAGYVGLFNAPSANTNLANVAAAGGTTVSALTLDDFVNTTLTVNPIVLKRKGTAWWMHPQILMKMVLIKDKMGRPIFQTYTEAPQPGSIGSILGYPIHLTAIAPTTDSASQPVVAFGEPAGVAVGVRSDLELATSDDIGFPQNLRCFRTLMRAGVKIKTIAASTTLKPVAVLQTAAA